MENTITFTEQGTGKTFDFKINKIFNAGYAGSDQQKVQEHIDELVKLGVPTPESTPTLFPISNNLLSSAERIQVQHDQTSGEIEYVLLWADGDIYVTVGSDHTDRRLETFSVPMSKQAYPNIIAKDVWRFEDVKDHWNKLEFTCWLFTNDGERELYQKGMVSDLLAPDQWKDYFQRLDVEGNGNVFFSATINTLTNSLTFGSSYEFQLEDPVLGRKITHQYAVEEMVKPIE